MNYYLEEARENANARAKASFALWSEREEARLKVKATTSSKTSKQSPADIKAAKMNAASKRWRSRNREMINAKSIIHYAQNRAKMHIRNKQNYKKRKEMKR